MGNRSGPGRHRWHLFASNRFCVKSAVHHVIDHSLWYYALVSKRERIYCSPTGCGRIATIAPSLRGPGEGRGLSALQLPLASRWVLMSCPLAFETGGMFSRQAALRGLQAPCRLES